MDASELRAAGEIFLAELRAGGFAPPPPGGWGVERVAAHVATSGALLGEVTQALLRGEPAGYDDRLAGDPTVLDDFVAFTPDLTLAVRAAGERLCSLVAELSPVQATRLVPVRMAGDEHDLVVEATLPWADVITTHARVHLPRHAEQLRRLRAVHRAADTGG